MIPCKLLRSNSRLPVKGSVDSAGFDLYYCPVIYDGENQYNFSRYEVQLSPQKRLLLPTGISLAIPKGYYGRIAPRSGLALKDGLDVLAGVIDSDWRGEVAVILYNTGDKSVTIQPYTRIAQLIIEKCDRFELCPVENLENTDRGENGFGSTGTK